MLLPCLLGAVALCVSSPLGLIQSPEQVFLKKLTGKWVLRGKIGRNETTHDVDAKWVLNQGYVQIHETSREKDAKGKPQYEAIVYVSWDSKKSQFACLWLDITETSSFAPVGIGQLGSNGNQVQFLFGDSDDGIETTFSFDEQKKSWTWNIDNLQKGKKSTFARLVLTKK